MPRVVLDPAAVADLLDHLEVVHRPRLQPLGFEQLALAAKLLEPPFELGLDALDRRADPLGRHDVVLGRVDEHLVLDGEDLGGYGVDVVDLLDLIAEELDPDGVGFIRRVQLDHVPADAEGAPLEIDVVAGVLDVGQAAEQGIAVVRLARADRDDAGLVVLRRAQAEDARDGRHDDAIPAGGQARRRRQPQPVQVGVAGGILLDVDVALRDVGLGLVVIVVADEVLDGVFREELLELLIELGGQGLVVRDQQDRLVELRDHVGHREGLAAAGHAHQRLESLALAQTINQPLDSLRLVACRLVLVVQPVYAHALFTVIVTGVLPPSYYYMLRARTLFVAAYPGRSVHVYGLVQPDVLRRMTPSYSFDGACNRASRMHRLHAT